MRLKPYIFSNVLNVLATQRTQRKVYKISELYNLEEKENILLLRFDVENSPEIALRFARKLSEIDFPATFYFHTRRNVFIPSIMREIQSLNHEVGFHYECLDRCHGNFPEARKLFIKEVNLFRKIGIDIKSVCGHSELFLPKNGYLLNNELILEYPELIKETNLLGEAYFLTRRFNMIHARDTFVRILNMYNQIQETKLDQGLHVLLHSHRWRDNLFESMYHSMKDLRQAWSNIKKGKREYELYHAE
ncbi:polysaccharide deacetylase family protein [Chitinophaga ginsengisoli]|uniref:Polysaccharide deacetylase n=1 Tax=Chitinophaga ginsengisoli TaxID=363837 RepID=A0A2P8FZE2_9BACT|nr:hypothetical protein [Chitinophaga ginsengisoli]PSL27090.1 hypothetical protein CLV42_110244 [Chitinophaga ginsengisoli]